MKVYILLGHPPSCTIIRFQLRLAQSSSPVRILWCNRMFVHLGERESQSEAVVSFRTVVTFFHLQRVPQVRRVSDYNREDTAEAQSLGQCVAVCCSVLQSEVQSTQDKTPKKTTTLILYEQ